MVEAMASSKKDAPAFDPVVTLPNGATLGRGRCRCKSGRHTNPGDSVDSAKARPRRDGAMASV